MAATGPEKSGATSATAAGVAIEWADAEGWNPGVDDAERFLRADPEAFLGMEQDGEVVATVSCALYGDRYAFIGCFIVRPDLRGRGLGGPLLDRALGRAGERVVGLDAVLAQQPYYERSGFGSAHGNVRWRAEGGGTRPAGLVDLASVPFNELLGFDAEVFGAERGAFLRAWIDRPPGQALAAVSPFGLAGYGVLRDCRVGAKIGPLFAEDERVADTLLVGLLAAAKPGSDVFVDIPQSNANAAALPDAHDMRPTFETARMYRNGRHPEALDRVFGVTTLEFG